MTDNKREKHCASSFLLNQSEDFDMNEDQRNEIRDTGELDLGGIHVMTVIGEIEGHQLSPQNSKTTKYEHMIPALAKAEYSDDIKGILILLNTVGGDVGLPLRK